MKTKTPLSHPEALEGYSNNPPRMFRPFDRLRIQHDQGINHCSKIFTIMALAIILVSCEGPKYFSVTVVDKVTQQPIDSVLVKVIVKAGKKEKSAYNLQGYTDTIGKFIRDEMIGYGLSIRRWDFYMEYDKIGYIHKSELNKTEGLVELEH